MKFEKTEVFNIEGALRGMRNPLASWAKSDSQKAYWNGIWNTQDDSIRDYISDFGVNYDIGDADMNLAQRLIKGGTEHRKFLRQIFVSVDITAPMYLMSELDTYKVGITRNSSSFMHKGISKEFEIEDFEYGDEKIREILSIRKSDTNDSNTQNIFYPYETNEYKLYRCKNGREYEVYRNGKLYALPFTYVDTLGRSRSFPKREVNPSVTKTGYWEVNIGGRDGEKWLLHRLVAYVWLENPNNYETIDHIDCNKNNNSVENLEWVTREENVKREFNNGLMRNNNMYADYINWKKSSKIDLLKKKQIKDMKARNILQSDIANLMDVSQSQVSAILRNDDNTSNNRQLFEECLIWETMLISLNDLRQQYLDTKDDFYFKEIRRLLPSSYLYKSTVTMNYENIRNMYFQRKNHRLTEWSKVFVEWVESLPYAKELLCYDPRKESANA